MQTPDEQPREPQQVPPRFWWLKRILIASAVFLLLLIALRVWWGHEAHRRLQAEIARVVAAGEPIFPEDFNPKENIPDEQNAARLYVQAEENFSLTADQTKVIEDVRRATLSIDGDQLEILRSIVKDNAEALQLARQARHAPGVDWGLRFHSPAFTTTFTSNLGDRQLGKLLRAVATYHAYVGDESECVETLLDILGLGRNLRQQPMLIAQIISLAIDAGALRAMEESVLVPYDAPASHPATTAQIRELLAGIANEADVAEGFRRGWFVERMSQLDLLTAIGGGAASVSMVFGGRPTPPARVDFLWETAYRPVFALDMVTISRDTQRRVDRVERGIYQRQSDADGPWGFLDSALHPYSSILQDSLDHPVRMYFRHLAARRLAATGLALRMFRAEHGHLPATLDELVPQYLPAIPKDPFAADGRALSYLPRTELPLVYSVGLDGVDDGGLYALRDGFVNTQKLDWPFFIDGKRVEPPVPLP